MKRILSLSLGLAVLLAGCITKQPQNLTPIPVNPEMVKLERQMIARMNLPPMPPTAAPRKSLLMAMPTATTKPSITAGLTNGITYQGTNYTFKITATGTAPLVYQWRMNNALIAGAKTNSYTITNVQPSNAATYSVLVTNSGGTASSSEYLAVGTTNVLPNCLAGTFSLTLAWCPSTVTTNNTNTPYGYYVYNGVGGTSNFIASVYSATNPCDPALSVGTNYCRCYTNRTDAGTNLSIIITNLFRGVTNCFAATTYDTNKLESDYSEEIQFATALPQPLTNFTLYINYLGSNQALLSTKVCPQSLLTLWYKKNLNAGSWTALATNQVPDVYGNFFYIDRTDKDASRFYKAQLQ